MARKRKLLLKTRKRCMDFIYGHHVVPIFLRFGWRRMTIEIMIGSGRDVGPTTRLYKSFLKV